MENAWRADQDYFEGRSWGLDEEEVGDPGSRTIAEDLVVTKYKMAGEIVNRVLQQVVARCVVGASVCDLCTYGDRLMSEETSKVFKRNSNVRTGTAFPTCVSVDNCVRNFSPTSGDPDRFLEPGDVVKVDMAGHVDGFIASVGHTLVLTEGPVIGRRADVLLAAHHASMGGLRALVPGGNTHSLAEIVSRVAGCYHCQPVQGTITQQLRQGGRAGGKRAVLGPDAGGAPDFNVAVYEVYALEVAVSTGEGIAREMDTRATIYKKVDDASYQLKLKASRSLLARIEDSMPFSLRDVPHETSARLGLTECLKHGLVEAFPVPYERSGEFVASFRSTVLLMPLGPHCITGLPFDLTRYHSENSIILDPPLTAFLARTINLRTIKKKKRQQLARRLEHSPKPTPLSRDALD